MKDTQLSVRLSGRIKAKLEEAARLDERSVSFIVAKILERWATSPDAPADQEKGPNDGA